MEKEYSIVNKSVRKKDSMQLLLGKPLYTEDLCPQNALVVKLLRSPHANAIVKNIDAKAAKTVPGVVGIFTWEDVPKKRYTIAGQTYPETSPYDRMIIDRHVRFVGDVVAIIAAETEKAAIKAMKLIKVEYEVLEAILDFRLAKGNEILVHPEEDWGIRSDVGADRMKNTVGSGTILDGDVDKVLADCDIVIDHVYQTKPFNQTPMETFRSFSELDRYGRLHVISSTQVVFHLRRTLAYVFDLPQNMVRVEKPRVGGGFGSKQSMMTEFYTAFVTMKTGRSAQIIFSREESFIAGNPRHEMELHVRLGAQKDGKIRGIDLYALSDTGAYGEHGWAVAGLVGSKSIALYTHSLEAFRYKFDVVYTNKVPSGAYRGFGATQGIFAVESAVNELAETLQMDPAKVREMNMVREGDFMKADDAEYATSCALERCLSRCGKLFGWEEKYPVVDMGNGKIRSSGMAIAMQGSSIANVDVGSATIKLNQDGSFSLIIGCADIGTGCDTVLSQIAAESLGCGYSEISVFGADTDASPYDSGSYASSTTYLTGKAVENACEDLKEKMKLIAAELLGCEADETVFDGKNIVNVKNGQKVDFNEIAHKSQFGSNIVAEATATHTSPISPPPFLVGMVQIELDKFTGEVKVLEFATVVDCGMPINPALARIQIEGGLTQAIGHTLTEDVHFSETGKLLENSFMQYKIPTRLEVGKFKVEFENSNEKTGPFGAKSVGEIVINSPAPAIAHAIYRATGKWHREIPIKPEEIALL